MNPQIIATCVVSLALGVTACDQRAREAAMRRSAHLSRPPDQRSRVDSYAHSKRDLYERAGALGVEGRLAMSKEELARPIGKKQ